MAKSCDSAARGKHRTWRRTNIVKAFKNYRRASVHRLQNFIWSCKMFKAFISGCLLNKAEYQSEAEIEPVDFFTDHNFQHFLETHVSPDAHSWYREQKEGTSEAVKALELPAHIIQLWRTDLASQYAKQQNFRRVAPQERVASLRKRWIDACTLEFDTGSFAADLLDEADQEQTEKTEDLDLWSQILHTRKMVASASGTFRGVTMRNDRIFRCMHELAQGWREVISKRVIQQADVAKTAQQVQAASKRKAAAVPAAIAAAVPAADSAMKNSVVFPGLESLRKLVAAQQRLVAEPFLQLVQARSACVVFLLLL